MVVLSLAYAILLWWDLPQVGLNSIKEVFTVLEVKGDREGRTKHD